MAETSRELPRWITEGPPPAVIVTAIVICLVNTVMSLFLGWAVWASICSVGVGWNACHYCFDRIERLRAASEREA